MKQKKEGLCDCDDKGSKRRFYGFAEKKGPTEGRQERKEVCIQGRRDRGRYMRNVKAVILLLSAWLLLCDEKEVKIVHKKGAAHRDRRAGVEDHGRVLSLLLLSAHASLLCF